MKNQNTNLDGDLIKEGILDYRIYSFDGKLMDSDRTDGQINTTQLTNGIYVLELLDEKGNAIGSQPYHIGRSKME